MQHVERLNPGFATAIGQGAHEGRPLARTIDSNQAVGVLQVDCVLVDVLHQRWNIVGHTEQYATCIEELCLDVPQATVAQPVIARQVQGLLRCTGTLDRHRRLGEQCPPFTKILH
ncbi:hypothetical protein D9M71_273040 [compost metagenome]